MRPHKLVMKAFGPFAKETAIDFDKLGDSIYLVAGETGAGKTMIFDAMSYALFGCASGERRNDLAGEELHCDLCADGKRKDPMFVDFTFSNGGKKYHLRRTVSWGVKGTNQKADKESLLEVDGGETIHGSKTEKKDDVTKKIVEILGLDATQFHRLIMLAQGEFQKFLEAGSDERGKIIGKIYNNSRHMDLECRIKNLNAHLEKRIAAASSNISQQLTFFNAPVDITEEEQTRLNVQRSELFETLTILNDRVKTGLDVCEKAKSKKDNELEALLAKEATAQNNNAQLSDLKKKEVELAALNSEKTVYDNLERKLDLAVRAQKVLPEEIAMSGEKDHFGKIVSALAKLYQVKEELAGKLTELISEQEKVIKENEPKIDALSKQIISIQDKLAVYDELEKSTSEYNSKAAAVSAAEDTKKAAEGELKKIVEREEELKKELLALADAGQAAVDNADTNLRNADSKVSAISTLSANVKTIRELLTDKETREINVSNCADETARALKAYTDINNRFIAGQADILAGNMITRLKEEDMASISCPVCGSEHTLAEMEERKASAPDDVPSREDVDGAMNLLDTKRSAYTKANEELAKLKATIDEKQTAAIEESGKLLGVSDWSLLEDGKVLSDALSESKAQKKAAADALAKAKAEKESKEAFERENAQIAADKADKDNIANRAAQALADAEKAAAIAEEKVSNCRKLLNGFPADKADAEASIEKQEKEKTDLKASIESSVKAVEKCRNEIAANGGNIDSSEKEKTASEVRSSQKERSFESALSANGFASVTDYEAALAPDGHKLEKAALDKWITVKKKTIDDYKVNVTGISAAVDQLKESTKGMVETDLDALEEAIKTLRSEKTRLENESKDLSGIYKTNSAAIGGIENNLKDREKLEKVYELIGPIVQKVSGKLAFNRFVLFDFFNNIIEQANIHLNTMTDGEFSFVRPEEEDGRSAQGLGLAVINNFTGAEKTFASMSGGQIFEASLAMALGLSEMVQMESASTIQIDSMFIDEGFGSLGSKDLNRALDVLKHLSDGKKQIGIISHVATLEEYLTNKITVTRDSSGSTIS